MLFLNDEGFRPIVVSIVKATFDIHPGAALKFSKKQIPINLDGTYWGDPENSSYRFEPESAFVKPATDVVVLGHALSVSGPTHALNVDIMVGSLRKRLTVFGNRYWTVARSGPVLSQPEPFERMPLVYENAFGGWDKRHTDPAFHAFEARNTVGKGYINSKVALGNGDRIPLPNIENPDDLIESWQDCPAPAGCGFLLPHWQPRAVLAGTYDKNWETSRNPLLPLDFDRRYFNAASEGLVADGYLVGDEEIIIRNMTSSGELAFRLPGVRTPVCDYVMGDSAYDIVLQLDTVIIDVDQLKLSLLWRGYAELGGSLHDIDRVRIQYG